MEKEDDDLAASTRLPWKVNNPAYIFILFPARTLYMVPYCTMLRGLIGSKRFARMYKGLLTFLGSDGILDLDFVLVALNIVHPVVL